MRILSMTDKSKPFTCGPCNYGCSKNAYLQKHLISKKHILKCCPNLEDPNDKFQCKRCFNKYKGLSGLWHHNKKCIPIVAETTVIAPIIENVIVGTIIESANVGELILVELKKINESNVELKKSNAELKKSIEALTDEVHSRQIVPSNVNNITTVTNNNININVFLNETCKNAVNLDSFIKNLMFEMADAKLMIGSYVEGTCSILQKTQINN